MIADIVETQVSYRWFLCREVFVACEEYRRQLAAGASAGGFLRKALSGADPGRLTTEEFLERLVHTKKTMIFAESEVAGDGSDWSPREMSLLGDVGMAVPVTVFDNGAHQNPVVHAVPFPGVLLFVPGALLAGSRGMTPSDLPGVATRGILDSEKFTRLYERRLLPALRCADEIAGEQGKMAFITIPGLGCGQFAGPFRGQLGRKLRDVLVAILHRHGASFSRIRAVYYDPYREGDNERLLIHGIPLLVRPLLAGNQGKSQLCHPESFQEAGDDFADDLLCSVVAWDHVSWPGNDFYGGSRVTDDGVKAAATDSMRVLTGIPGTYHPGTHSYVPPSPHRIWGEVVAERAIQLRVRGNLSLY
jgi:hypothetical protein